MCQPHPSQGAGPGSSPVQPVEEGTAMCLWGERTVFISRQALFPMRLFSLWKIDGITFSWVFQLPPTSRPWAIIAPGPSDTSSYITGWTNLCGLEKPGTGQASEHPVTWILGLWWDQWLFLDPFPSTMGVHTMEGHCCNSGQEGSRADLTPKHPVQDVSRGSHLKPPGSRMPRQMGVGGRSSL